jgi:GMP synthase-like glutamine amidotransferase
VRVLSLIHGPDARAGVFGDVVRDAGHELHQVSYALDQPPSRPLAEYDAAMVFGGSMNTHEEDAHPWLRPEKEAIRELYEEGVPLLGVCLGSQLIADVAGGAVRRATEPEIGWYDVELTAEAGGDSVFGTVPKRFVAYQWHSYASTLPQGAVELARSPVCVQGYRLGDRTWGMQFHAEVTQQTAETWIAHYRTDPDAVERGFDPEAARAELAERIQGWNAIGRALAGGFIRHAESLVSAIRSRTTA